MPKSWMIGNWKMNQSLSDITDFFDGIEKADIGVGNFGIAPQTLHLGEAVKAATKLGFLVGSQNCSQNNFGAFTGEVAVESLKEIGVNFTLIGHSERRSIYKETDTEINAKVLKAASAELLPVLCIGESLQEREANKTIDIVIGQLKAGLKGLELKHSDDIVIAYEPVWAIGTGKTASPEQAQEVHAQIRATLNELYPEQGAKISILYGGSVKPANVDELLAQADINGGLVGGASLKSDSYIDLCKATL